MRDVSHSSWSLLQSERDSGKSQSNPQPTRSEHLVQPFVESTQHNKWTLNCLIPAACTLKAELIMDIHPGTLRLTVYFFWATAAF